MLTESELLRLAEREVASVLVGRLPDAVASHFNAHTVLVRLGFKSYEHIKERHPSIISDGEIFLLPRAIQIGLYVQEKERPRFLTVCFQHPDIEGRRYNAGLKFAVGTHEIWVSTFHRGKPRQTRRMLDRGAKIRSHL